MYGRSIVQKHSGYFLTVIMLIVLSVFSSQVHAVVMDRTGTMWAPYIEWSLDNSSYSGNPFDLVATATFTHTASGETRSTEMFYAGGTIWKFRFAGTKTGTWTFTTASSDAELAGHTGTVTINPNLDSNIKGFLTTYGTKFARQSGENGELQGFLLNVYQNANTGEFPLNGNLTSFADPGYVDAYIQQAKTNGFNTIFAVVYNEWFKLGALTTRDHNSVDPDNQSFSALETLISRAHANGVNVHIWAWGDDDRNWTPIGAGGINGTPDKRVQRHIAARLGPMPGWTMSYGFDLEEWVSETQLQEWSDYLNARWGWKHLLWARLRSNSSLDVVSNDVWDVNLTKYSNTINFLNNSNGRPVFYERRYLYTRDGFTMDKTRQALWQNAMAGGAGSWWGAYWDKPGPAYPNPEQLRTHANFWQNRFMLDMEPANSLTDGYALSVPGNLHYVFYKENTSSVQINLSGMGAAAQSAIAIDTKNNYVEIDLGTLTASNQTWNAPYTSDWAIAVGNFEQQGGNTVPSPPGTPTGEQIQQNTQPQG